MLNPLGDKTLCGDPTPPRCFPSSRHRSRRWSCLLEKPRGRSPAPTKAFSRPPRVASRCEPASQRGALRALAPHLLVACSGRLEEHSGPVQTKSSVTSSHNSELGCSDPTGECHGEPPLGSYSRRRLRREWKDQTRPCQPPRPARLDSPRHR